MLRLTAEQYERFVALRRGAYEGKVCEILTRKYPKHTEAMSSDQLLQFVSVGIGRARRYGIANQRSVFKFIVLMLIAGSRFDEDPAVQYILEDQTLDPDDRPEVLFHATVNTAKRSM
ncbi:MAG: hypothetical protein EA376_01910 [Phycisphaeraceae bacterium]|nr:MAG: hypothetical protein EA376_01910 [Phycisphaeraceae bacterium]